MTLLERIPVSRRGFLKTTAGAAASGLVLGISPRLASAFSPEKDAGVFEPNVFVQIDGSGQVRLWVHRSEMGQQVRTSMPMLLAEELEVAWKDIEIVQALGHPKYGDQNTDGSTSVRVNWVGLRKAGAAAREMLIAAAAKTWGVAGGECYADSSTVIHRPSGRKLGYGKLVPVAATLPVPDNPPLKRAGDFKIIGKGRVGIDVKDVVQGKAQFGIDVRVPDMLYASIERSPTVRGRVKSFDPAPALAVRGVRKVVQLDGLPQPVNTNNAVAVVGDSTWAAYQGRNALRIEWDHGAEPLENSESFRKLLEETAAGTGRLIRAEGDYQKAKSGAQRVLRASYHSPHLVHAPMEPLAAVAQVSSDRCEIWTPSQDPQWVRSEAAKFLKIPEDNVSVHVTLLGGAFGRKSKPDFVLEAVALAKQVGAPVKVTWTREDEIQHGFYRGENYQIIEATLDAANEPTGWYHHTVFPTIGTTFNPQASEHEGWELAMGFINMPFRIPNVRLEASVVKSDLRMGWLRSVCNTFHAFAANSFVEELAVETRQDPVALRLKLLGEPRILEFSDEDKKSPFKFDTGRFSQVIREAAAMSGWGGKRPAGEGLGFAAHYSFLTYVAMALHASVDPRGSVKVHQVDCVVDCGTVVNPDTVLAQVEGSVVFGLTLALYGEITVKDGVVRQSNFSDYPMLVLPEMPKVNLKLIASDRDPTGVGEPVVPPVAPALTSAIFAATGKRIRDLPLSRHKLA